MKIILISKNKSGESSWYNNRVGEIFEVAQCSSIKQYYTVIEDKIKTNKIIPKEICEKIRD